MHRGASSWSGAANIGQEGKEENWQTERPKSERCESDQTAKQAGQLSWGRAYQERTGSIQMLQNGMTSNWMIPKFIIQTRQKLFWMFSKKPASVCNTWDLLHYTVCMIRSGVVLIQTCSSRFQSCLGSGSLAVLASWPFHRFLIAASLAPSQTSNIIRWIKAFGIVDRSMYT